MGRKILFVTTDQQRYDSLGCNGGRHARTPVVDALAASGINYRRAHCNNVVCMPARSTMLTGQYVRTHGVWANGVPLPPDHPSVARYLNEHGYRTALVGKTHFEPFVDMQKKYYESRMASLGEYGPYRGFDYVIQAGHTGRGLWHYAHWLKANHPDQVAGFYPVMTRDMQVNHAGGGETGAPQVWHNPIPRDLYHTDWVADHAIAWLDSLDAADDWFLWLSFPDPHHPWDPPQSERHRIDWRDVALQDAYPTDAGERLRILAGKPAHWMEYYRGRKVTNMESPPQLVCEGITADQFREINAMNHIETELIDEACGRVLERIGARGWGDDTDVIFTTDHGELQGDFGLLFKGPYHVDALMRLPLIWRPAKRAGVAPAEVTAPVQQVDYAPTFCDIAGLPVPGWMQGRPLPASDTDAAARGFVRTLTEWDNEFASSAMHLRTIYRDGWVCTACEPGTIHDGTEGELYNLADDPNQFANRWADPACAGIRRDLVADLYDTLPPARDPKLAKEAPA